MKGKNEAVGPASLQTTSFRLLSAISLFLGYQRRDEINYSESHERVLMNNWEGAKACDLGGKEMRFDLCQSYIRQLPRYKGFGLPWTDHFQARELPLAHAIGHSYRNRTLSLPDSGYQSQSSWK